MEKKIKDNIEYIIKNFETISSNLNRDDLNNFYLEELKSKQNQRLKTYVKKHRDNGQKIMLIVGAIPTQKDKFVIYDNIVPVYLENNFSLDYYNLKKQNSFIRKQILTLSFDECPIIFYDILSEEFKNLNIGFDIIIFDYAVTKFLDITPDKLINLFELTYDNTSLIILERIGGLRFTDLDSFIKRKLTPIIPFYDITFRPNNIIKKLTEWFNLFFNDDIDIITTSYYGIEGKKKILKNDFKFVNECVFTFILENTIKNNPKTSMLVYNNNIFFSNNIIKEKNIIHGVNADNFNMYFVNTKIILNELGIYTETEPKTKPNVLVLCQRKTGPFDEESVYQGNVEDILVPNLEKFIYSIHPNANIKYLSKITEENIGTVDYNLILDEYDDDNALEFVEKYKDSFDLIVLNTCPFIFMDYKLINLLLKKNGKIIFSAFNGSIGESYELNYKPIEKKFEDKSLDIYNWFTREDDNLLIFTKKDI